MIVIDALDQIIRDALETCLEALEAEKKSLEAGIDRLVDEQISDISEEMTNIVRNIVECPIGTTGIEGKFQTLIRHGIKLQELKLIAARSNNPEYVGEVQGRLMKIAEKRHAIGFFLSQFNQQ